MNAGHSQTNGPGSSRQGGATSRASPHDAPDILFSPPSVLARGAEDSSHAMLAKLAKAMSAPRTQPCALEVCITTVVAIEQVLRQLEAKDQQLVQWLAAARSLQQHLLEKLGGAHRSSAQNLKGKMSDHPVWVCFAKIGMDIPTDCATLILLGCAVIVAFVDGKSIPRSLPRNLAALQAIGPIDEVQFHALMAGTNEHDIGINEGVRLLRRLWQRVIGKFSADQTGPVKTPNEAIHSQILSSALNPAPRHVAGAAHHRLLTPEQFDQVLERMRSDLAKQLLKGVLCFLVMRTGLSVEVAAKLPLEQEPKPSDHSCLDVNGATVVISLSLIANEASQPLLGSLVATHQLRVHLPVHLGQLLEARLAQHPDAKLLQDLFPDEPVPDRDAEIYLSTAGFKCTWSRLRYTLGLYLRYQGHNKLYAGLLSGDFGISPRSKLHYAAVPASEFYRLEQQLHLAIGLDETIPLRDQDEPGIGCAVVPLTKNVQFHDALLAHDVRQKHPGKSGHLETLHSFHNAYTRLIGWRLSLLLALRETTILELDAGIDAHDDKWVPLHDKSTRQDRGFQPVPMCDYVCMLLLLYREHCRATAARVLGLTGKSTSFSRWCETVGKGHKVRLLSLVSNDNEIHGLPSRYFTSRKELAKAGFPIKDMAYELAPDVGRKVMENELRVAGARSSDVDAFLRHFMQGQEPASVFDPAVLDTSIRRIIGFQQKVAVSLLGPPEVGLSKGLLRQTALEAAYKCRLTP